MSCCCILTCCVGNGAVATAAEVVNSVSEEILRKIKFSFEPVVLNWPRTWCFSSKGFEYNILLSFFVNTGLSFHHLLFFSYVLWPSFSTGQGSMIIRSTLVATTCLFALNAGQYISQFLDFSFPYSLNLVFAKVERKKFSPMFDHND